MSSGPQTSGTTRKLEDSACAQAYANSLKCLDKNAYDKKKCQAEFDAYKECKKQQFEADRLARQANRKGFFG